jgi:phosphoserine phosphatase RsbU/P
MQATRQAALKNWRFEQLALVRSVSFQIANVLDLDELARRVTGLILNTFKYYYVAIFTLAPGASVLQFRASARSPSCCGEGESPSPGFPVALGEGIVGYVAQTGQELVAGKVDREPQFRYIELLPETRSEVALPLKSGSRVLGVLDIQSDQSGAFHDIDMLVLRSLADNISLAVEGARLYSAIQHRAEQIATAAEIGRSITSILDLDELVKEVVSTIHKRFGYPFVHVFTVHPGRRKIFFQAGSGARSIAMQALETSFDLDDPQGIIPQVARSGAILLANDVSQEPLYRAGGVPPEVTCSEIAIPLVSAGEVLGVLDIQSSLCNAFEEDDRSLLETLAGNIAVAMRNALLYRSERWRRQVAESLRDVAGLLSSNAVLDRLLDSILAELERILPCEIAGIWLLEEDSTGFKLAAVRGLSQDSFQSLSHLDPLAEGCLARALQASLPIIRSPQDPPGPFASLLGADGAYSAVAAPLRVNNKSLGVLALGHHNLNRYGHEAQGLTMAFASYVAVAIENAHLFASSQEQAWISTVLLQVNEATRAISSIDELASTIVRLTPMLVGVKGCALFLWNETLQAFSLQSYYGEPALPVQPAQPDLPAQSGPLLITPGQSPALAHLLVARQPVTVSDFTTDLPLLAPDQTTQPANAVLLPLATHTEFLGALLVTYADEAQSRRTASSANAASAASAASAAIDENRLSILQGIAQQTSIAIQNLRLLDARQEEAYVTAVLLQVAQAVVSLQSLPDILDSIVHIMPVLVGIDHSLIILRNEQDQAFPPRFVFSDSAQNESALLACCYSPGDFPLLDAIWEHDSIILCALPEGGLPPLEWPSLPVPPTPQDTQTLLHSPSGLLMGFPLSVKGERFGILLAADVSGKPGFRQRRLEILTGIAQQASLAIQNDHLDREMIERERMNREMQLAREIQQSFLPQTLPELPGWVFDIRWQTARQVGGDFYDIFLLPNGRVALVIADVSDKGLPAALYMTVARTLIRAGALDYPSPARALENVNEVMVSNSSRGMFVTAFYAVLDPQSGQIIFANAGHNLPMIWRAADGSVETLPGGGTALGAFEDYRLKEQRTRLQPGDTLLLYTDGVTETFSPKNDMYGEDRLTQVVHSCGECSPANLLDGVEADVAGFRQSAPVTDDITLVALKFLP